MWNYRKPHSFIACRTLSVAWNMQKIHSHSISGWVTCWKGVYHCGSCQTLLLYIFTPASTANFTNLRCSFQTQSCKALVHRVRRTLNTVTIPRQATVLHNDNNGNKLKTTKYQFKTEFLWHNDGHWARVREKWEHLARNKAHSGITQRFPWRSLGGK